jgi:hypothetical protein
MLRFLSHGKIAWQDRFIRSATGLHIPAARAEGDSLGEIVS